MKTADQLQKEWVELEKEYDTIQELLSKCHERIKENTRQWNIARDREMQEVSETRVMSTLTFLK